MKKTAFIILWTIFWLAMESTILSSLPTKATRLDMVFLAVIAIGFSAELHEGIAPVMLIGIISDAISPAPFGIMTATYLTAFALIRFASATIYLNSVLARFVWTTIASAAAIFIKALLVLLVYKNPAFITLATWRVAPQALFNGLVGIAVIPLFGWYLNLTWEKLTRPKGLVLK